MPKSSWHPFGEIALPFITVRVGRPKQPPKITEITRPDGRVVYLVRAVVMGRDRRKIVASYDEAKLLAQQWSGDRNEELRVLPTRLSAVELGDAEAASRMLKTMGLGFVEAAKWLVSNYQKPSSVTFESAIRNYEIDRRKVGIALFGLQPFQGEANEGGAFADHVVGGIFFNGSDELRIGDAGGKDNAHGHYLGNKAPHARGAYRCRKTQGRG